MCHSISAGVHSAVFGVYDCVEIETGPQLHGTVLYGPQASTRFRRSPSLLPTFFSRSLIRMEVPFLWDQQQSEKGKEKHNRKIVGY